MLPVCNVLRDLIKEAMKRVTSQTLDIFGPYPKKSFSKHVNIKCADNRESIPIKFNKNRIDVKCTFKKIPLKQAKKKLHLTLYQGNLNIIMSRIFVAYHGIQITFVIIYRTLHSILMRMKQLSIVHLHQ